MRYEAMKIFISWSGAAGSKCAEELRDWLPYINPTLSPFVSSRDISKGERGLPKIASELKDCAFGIVCVTRDNQAAPWINFESGALSRELGESMLAPFLLDLDVKDLEGPLTQFQATDSRHKDEVWALVESINEKSETSVDPGRLLVTFNRFWGDLDEKLSAIREAAPESATPIRETPDILNELVALIREQSGRIQRLEGVINEKTGQFTSNYTINDPREVVIEADSPPRMRSNDRLDFTRTELSELIGADNIVRWRAQHRKKPEVEVLCTMEGVARARSNSGAIGAVANRYGVVITVESTKDNTRLGWTPEESVS
ncbi:TIR domain-containing protein [Streptomyces sp. NPDC059810]|uniref:TIR domain-containing protein n=1 Tax=Streptomyces sp. NPDC059810 TaxID=3346956 RepID=UPI003653717F